MESRRTSARKEYEGLVQDFPSRRFEELGQKIEARRLAGPVRADQRVNTPTADLERNVADGEEARELLGQAFRFENELIGQTDFPLPAQYAWLSLVTSAFRGPWSLSRNVASGRGICRR